MDDDSARSMHVCEGLLCTHEGLALGVCEEARAAPAPGSIHRRDAHPSLAACVQPELQELPVVMATEAHWRPKPVSHPGPPLWARGHEGVGGRVRIICVPVCEGNS